MTRKAEEKNPAIGSGEHKYECIHNWGELPADYAWQTTHNVATDSEVPVYITHHSIGKQMDTVLVFDPKGKFVRSFGKDWHGGGHGIEISQGRQRRVHLSVQHLDPEDEAREDRPQGQSGVGERPPRVQGIRAAARRQGPQETVSRTAYNPDEHFLLPDGFDGRRRLRLQLPAELDKDGKLVKVYGGGGDKLGQPGRRTVTGSTPATRTSPYLLRDRANA
ncbi:MAG: hypothetical protein U0792_11680 [Gemmataceae bacterium]